jgi:hypothetical protein
MSEVDWSALTPGNLDDCYIGSTNACADYRIMEDLSNGVAEGCYCSGKMSGLAAHEKCSAYLEYAEHNLELETAANG